MKNNDEFKDIISVLKIITPHSKKFDNFLLSEYSSNKFKFRELIKQLNNIISNQKSSKNRNLITNINEAILKKLEEFLLSTESKNLTTNDIVNKIIEITAEIENTKDEKFLDKIVNNKEKIKITKETFVKFNIQNEQQAKDKIDMLNQKINSLKMALSGVKNSTVANIIMTEINNLSSQINELKNAVSTIIDNEISR